MKYRAHAKKTDGNQKDVVKALEKIGAIVQSLGEVGKGCPDLMVGYRGYTILMEVKDPDGKNRLEQSQKDWIKAWKGSPVHVVRSETEAVLVASSYGL